MNWDGENLYLRESEKCYVLQLTNWNVTNDNQDQRFGKCLRNIQFSTRANPYAVSDYSFSVTLRGSMAGTVAHKIGLQVLLLLCDTLQVRNCRVYFFS